MLSTSLDGSLHTATADQTYGYGRPHYCSRDPYADAGTTIVAFDVATDGNVANAAIDTPSGSRRLDDASLDCVKNWHYRPAVKDGQPIQVRWKAKIIWNPALPSDLDRSVKYCAKSLRAQPEFSDVNSYSVFSVVYEKMVLTSVTLDRASGNSALDAAVIDCLKQPHGQDDEMETVVVGRRWNFSDKTTFSIKMDWPSFPKQ